MGIPRARRPETTVLSISQGDTITVRKHLTSGESRAIARQSYVTDPVSGSTVMGNPVDIGLARVCGYLIDWTLTDARQEPIAIWQQPPDVVRAALDAIDPECYVEILRAIELHDDAMRAERTQKKTIPDGIATPFSSSESPFVPA